MISIPLVQNDFEFVLSALEAVEEINEAPDIPHEERVGSSGSDISRPTERAALRRSPAKTWLKDFERLVGDLLSLRNRADIMVGNLDEFKVCPRCHMIIQEEERTHKSGGLVWHHRCYTAKLREIRRKEKLAEAAAQALRGGIR